MAIEYAIPERHAGLDGVRLYSTILKFALAVLRTAVKPRA